MAFPKISSECLLATITKASQQPQDVFAAEFMVDMLREQPDVMEVIVGLLEPWLTPQPEIETVDLAQAQDIILQSCFAVLGIVLKSLNAQQEADEMNEAWGE